MYEKILAVDGPKHSQEGCISRIELAKKTNNGKVMALFVIDVAKE
jgi:hypothetical protein